MLSGRYSCQFIMKLKFVQHIFEKFSDIEFHERPYCGSGVQCGPPETREETNSRFSQYCERALKLF
jgi:hypothetical protein